MSNIVHDANREDLKLLCRIYHIKLPWLFWTKKGVRKKILEVENNRNFHSV